MPSDAARSYLRTVRHSRAFRVDVGRCAHSPEHRTETQSEETRSLVWGAGLIASAVRKNLRPWSSHGGAEFASGAGSVQFSPRR